MSVDDTIREIFSSINLGHSLPDDVAHAEIDGNKILDSHMLPGITMDSEELDDGIEATLRVARGVRVAKPVHLCFGVLPENGVQHIRLHVFVEDDAEVDVLAHCTFPNAVDVLHKMTADLHIGKNARYSYFERHVHGEGGGVTVDARAKVDVAEGGRFKTEFELIKGRVGKMYIDYDTTCAAQGTVEMTARISGREDDTIEIHENALLAGEQARGVLNSYLAVRDRAAARIYNKLVATAPYARGHVDCKEIVQGEATATAVPIVDVQNPKAHITHEAAIGSVDSKQLETLMSRGLDEDEAVDLIIEGLLT